jgi:hypothetical protein
MPYYGSSKYIEEKDGSGSTLRTGSPLPIV